MPGAWPASLKTMTMRPHQALVTESGLLLALCPGAIDVRYCVNAHALREDETDGVGVRAAPGCGRGSSRMLVLDAGDGQVEFTRDEVERAASNAVEARHPSSGFCNARVLRFGCRREGERLALQYAVVEYETAEVRDLAEVLGSVVSAALASCEENTDALAALEQLISMARRHDR